MTSFRDARIILLDAFDDNLIDEDEFDLLYDLNAALDNCFGFIDGTVRAANMSTKSESKATKFIMATRGFTP